MKKEFLAYVCILLTFCCVIGVLPAAAADSSADEAQQLIDSIISYKEKEAVVPSVQEWIDGDLTACAGTTAEWYCMALHQYDSSLDFSCYIAALEKYVSENRTASATTRQKLALALIAFGRTDNDFVKSTLEDSIGEQGIMSWIYGLHLLNNGVTSSKYSADDAVEMLLSLEKTDGGWALKGDISDIDVTAMTVQALAPYYQTNADVKTAVDAALDLLGSRQLDDGGYQSYGTDNPESTAQVIVALSAVGIDPERDARFIKNGHTVIDAMLTFQLSDGSFRHTMDGESNLTATTQAFYSLVALYRMRNGLGPLYVFDPYTTVGTEETAVTEENETAAVTVSEDTPETAPAETAAPTESGEAVTTETAEKGTVSYKVWACLAVLAVMLLACLILWLCGKRHGKNFLFVLIVGAAAVCFILCTDFQSRESYYQGSTQKDGAVGTVTLTIRCDTIVGKADSPYIPADGVILPVTEFEIADGDSVFDVLTEAAKAYSIQMENEGSVLGAHGMSYISGINYLYEFDFGDLSGWVYHVNGVAPSVGCGDYVLSDGDAIEWLYTCDLGEDVK